MDSVAARRYRDLVERSLDGIVLHTDGYVAYANRAAQRMLGADAPYALVGHPIDEFLEPPYLSAVHEELLRPGSVRMPFVERRLRRLDGTHLDVEVAAIPFVYENRPSVQLVLRDIRERVKARAALLWAESQFRVLAEQMPFVMWTSDDVGVSSVIGDRSSPFGARVLAALEAREPLPLHEATPPLDEAELLLEQGEQPTLNLAVGGRCYALRLEPLHDASGALVGRLGVAFDVTAWVRTQELLRDALRLEAVGQLAGGVAHEINNILAIISLNASMLERGATSATGAEQARQIIDSTRRAADVTSDLLGFAMRGIHRPAPTDINDLVAGVAELVGRTAPAQVLIDLQLARDLPYVLADRPSLSRALMSLCVNAIDAMQAGGRLILETSRMAPRRPQPDGSDQVRIRVIDNGAGMSEADRKRAFEPFFSADRSRRHVGLGLSMAQGVVRQHHGRIRLQSQLGVGTTVTVALPAMTSPPPERPSPRASGDVSQRPKALIVDDEPVLRAASSALVATLGYTGVQAPDGATAIDRFRQAPGDFAFVLLDVLMPGMSGIEALAELRAIDPDVRVILCTGYPRGELGAEVFAMGNVEYLGKPYRRQDLSDLVDKVTGRGPA